MKPPRLSPERERALPRTPPDAPADAPAEARTGPAAPPPRGLLDHPLRLRTALVVLIILLALPTLASALKQEFYIGLAARVLIFALAATSLNLILGFGGMISFGHAAFLGLGAYTVGILLQSGITSAWIAWPVAIAACALFATLVGSISLRTKGVYFIMVTLAFAQMAYFVFHDTPYGGGSDGI